MIGEPQPKARRANMEELYASTAARKRSGR